MSPLHRLLFAAGIFLTAALILVANFLATPIDHLPPSAGVTKAIYGIPLALALYYGCAALVVFRRRPGCEPIVVQYRPPDGITPAEARYLYALTCDGRTYAACAVDLAARGFVAIEPRPDGVYVRSAASVADPANGVLPADLPEEERFVFNNLFSRYEIAFLKPPPPELLDRISLVLEMGKTSAYYDYRASFVAIGLTTMTMAAVAVAGGMGLFTRVTGEIDFTIAAFLGACLFGAGWTSFSYWQRNNRAVLLAWRGIYPYRIGFFLLAALLIMPALFWFVMHPISPQFANVTVLMLLVNTFAPPFLMGYTPQGNRVVRHLLGYRHFIESTEQHRLDRLDALGAGTKADLTLIAYAIALDIRESWGDRLGAATIVETAANRLL